MHWGPTTHILLLMPPASVAPPCSLTALRFISQRKQHQRTEWNKCERTSNTENNNIVMIYNKRRFILVEFITVSWPGPNSVALVSSATLAKMILSSGENRQKHTK